MDFEDGFYVNHFIVIAQKGQRFSLHCWSPSRVPSKSLSIKDMNSAHSEIMKHNLN
ncbi:hypothetical protein Syun_012338 [Stephania yunnanensis]|uniref:Uncharacterized protein n=1 Tax=Stephania yunnanensis TaxID=152371 RepID=A0AAP0K0M8_9MAGN